MPYKFTFDLSKIPTLFLTEIAKVGYRKRVGVKLQQIIRRFKIEEITGLNLSDVVMLLQDFVDIQAENFAERKRFAKTKTRALFLPHCSRKYMDSRCKASFNQNTSSFECVHCSGDCLVGKAAVFAEKRNYDVYVLPGGSCIPKILKAKKYEGIIGVACCSEIKAGVNLLRLSRVSSQTVPLTKNGCANTRFNLETLFRTLERA